MSTISPPRFNGTTAHCGSSQRLAPFSPSQAKTFRSLHIYLLRTISPTHCGRLQPYNQVLASLSLAPWSYKWCLMNETPGGSNTRSRLSVPAQGNKADEARDSVASRVSVTVALSHVPPPELSSSSTTYSTSPPKLDVVAVCPTLAPNLEDGKDVWIF